MNNTAAVVETGVEGPEAVEAALVFLLLTFLLEVPETSQNSSALQKHFTNNQHHGASQGVLGVKTFNVPDYEFLYHQLLVMLPLANYSMPLKIIIFVYKYG